jgi:hypothetical protein
LNAVNTYGEEVEEVKKLKSAEPENFPPQYPASEMEHFNGQFVLSGLVKVNSPSKTMLSLADPGV